jgi:3-hydroxybutyryl-CoA dehydrogenase
LKAAAFFQSLGWTFHIAPDVPGMVSARVIAMIVNEAYFALGEGVSTKSEIDIAMKLGTNYPFGPFEWSEKIGLWRIYHLLQILSSKDMRYTTAPALDLAIKQGD